jgi:hypothetical protein
MLGLTGLSIALGSVPTGGRVTDDTAIYQNLSEIRVARQADLNFDGDIARLSALEGNYREKLPSLAQNPRLRGPIQRISQQKYKYSGARKSVTRR